MTKLKKLVAQRNIAMIIFCIVAVLGVGLVAMAYNNQANTVMENVNIETYNEAPVNDMEAPLGSMTSPDVFSYLKVYGRFMQGGSILASSTDATVGTLTAAQFRVNKQLDYTITNAANTLTLMATSTLKGIIPNAGNCMDFKIRNVSTTSASSTTIAAGTGMDLVENENGDVVIEGGNEAYLRFCRETDTDVTVSVDEYQAAD